MIGSIYYPSQKIPERCEHSFVDYQEYQNKLQKALLFNEATYDIFKTHSVSAYLIRYAMLVYHISVSFKWVWNFTL